MGDDYFRVSVPNALKLARTLELCQWQETSTDRSVRNSDGSETVVRTYFYHKAWLPHHVPSIFFDQPAAHFNPPPPTIPTLNEVAPSVRLGAYTARADIISTLPLSRTLHFDPPSLHAGFTSSAAASNGFRYVGGGYFLLPFDPLPRERIALMAAQYLEGTLLDFQIGDLFAVCNAGDARVSFQTADPPLVSVLARVANAGGVLEPQPTSSGVAVGFMRGGVKSADEIAAEVLGEMRWPMYLLRFASAVLAMVATGGVLPGLLLAGGFYGAMWTLMGGVGLHSLLALLLLAAPASIKPQVKVK
jgi:hypothetical protein